MCNIFILLKNFIKRKLAKFVYPAWCEIYKKDIARIIEKRLKNNC